MKQLFTDDQQQHDVDKPFKLRINYHSSLRSATLCGSLLCSVSLLARLGAAEADGIEFIAGGELQFGVTLAAEDQLSDGEGDRGYAFFTDSEIYIEADVSPSDDLEIGAEVVLNADIEDVNADETFIFMEAGFGLLQLGRTAGAEDEMALGADTIAAGTGGIDGDTVNLGETQIIGSEDAAKISYFTPRLVGFQAGLSFTPDTGDNEGNANDIDEDEELEDLENHIGLGLNFVGALGDVQIGLAAVGSHGDSEDPERNDLDAFSVGGTLGLDDIELGASYGKNNEADDFQFATVGGTVSIGEANVGIGYNYLDEQVDGITHVIALSGDIEFLEGVELQGDVSYADPEGRRTNIASVLAVELSF